MSDGMHVLSVKIAKSAIDDVFGDTSVSQEQTLESLGALNDFIESCMAAIKEDLRNS